MKTLSVTYVRRHWGAVLDLVEQGEQIVITRRGEPVARLVPVTEH